MDDIAGLKWTSTPSNGQKPAPSTSNYSAFSTLKPTPPTSGRASPLNHPPSQPPSKPSTPANDSFANLVSFGPTSSKNLSLSEQQKRQAEAKLQQQKVQSQHVKDQFAGGDDQFWNNLGSGRGTPTIDSTKNQTTNARSNGLGGGDDDDIFAAFNKPAPVKNDAPVRPVQQNAMNDDDDDPFGLSEIGPRRADTAATMSTVDDDDDVLGLLGKPVSARPRQELPPGPKETAADIHPQDKAIAELVDMGFPADKAKTALENTDSGIDVQAAVGILLNQAHAEARQKSQPRGAGRQEVPPEQTRRAAHVEARSPGTRPRWDDGDDSRARARGTTPAGEKDLEQMAAEFGSNFLKTANSLWKQGTKRVQQAVHEFNSDNDASGSHPKWMRDTAEQPTRIESRPRRQHTEVVPDQKRRSPAEGSGQANMTDEAMMLEGSRPTPPPRPSTSSQRGDRRIDPGIDSPRDHSPVIPSRLRDTLPQSQPAFLRQQNQSPAGSARATLNKAAAEEQAAQAYVSSARRRKPQPQPASSASPAASPNPDLLEGGFKDSTADSPRATVSSAASKTRSPRPQTVPSTKRVETPPVQVRPPAPTRNIPNVSVIALKASNTQRERGNEHFKRGDYASAHQSYAISLSHLPDMHPLTIILLTNRALTALKVGEPKSAITDADKAISLIGPSKGENETVTTGDNAIKPMREYYGKALMRKAEALEQMEKWSDAALVWREAVEGGHGGSTSIQGRMRAEKAANPSSSQRPKPSAAATAPAAPRKPPALRRPAAKPSSTAPAEAVSRLRAANAQAEQIDDEKFRLSEGIDARVNAWKSGKQDNLRALLGSLDQVLWESSGWKKISMADLVLPGKVKVQYMKGIGRVHPDKVWFFPSLRSCQWLFPGWCSADC